VKVRLHEVKARSNFTDEGCARPLTSRYTAIENGGGAAFLSSNLSELLKPGLARLQLRVYLSAVNDLGPPKGCRMQAAQICVPKDPMCVLSSCLTFAGWSQASRGGYLCRPKPRVDDRSFTCSRVSDGPLARLVGCRTLVA
jgi:hypothetical protein